MYRYTWCVFIPPPVLLLESQNPRMEKSKSKCGRSKIRKAKQRLKAAECKKILKSDLDEYRAVLQREKKACELLLRYDLVAPVENDVCPGMAH